TKPEQTAPPRAQTSAQRIAPWSTKSATKEQPVEEPISSPQEVRTRIELDARGRVAKIEYANETSRTFIYDADGLVLEFQQQNGRVTKRNPDSTWTSYTRDGRQMNVSGKASLFVDREGNLIWEYQQDGSASIQKLDGAVVAINNRGELQKYGSPSDR